MAKEYVPPVSRWERASQGEGHKSKRCRTLSLSPVSRHACGAEYLQAHIEGEWLRKYNASEAVQYKMTQKAKAYAKFKPRKVKGETEPIERVVEQPRVTEGKLRFSGRGKLKVKGFGPWA